MKCPFCEWSKQDYGKYWFPSDEELDYALSISPCSLTLSGGGDPLYHYEQNKDKILHFIDYVTKRNAVASIYTHNIPILWKYKEELVALPVKYIISINRNISPLEQLVIQFYKQHDKVARFSVVFNDNNIEEPDWDAITKMATICSPVYITFREHWVYPYTDRQKVREWKKQLRSLHCGLVPSDKPLNVVVMFEGKLTTCGVIDHTVLKIK